MDEQEGLAYEVEEDYSKFQFDQNFQRKLLALLVRSENYVSVYYKALDPDYFTYEQYKLIWKIVVAYYSKYFELPDLIVYGEEFRKIFEDDFDYQFYLQEVESLITLPVENEEYILEQVDEFLKFQRIRSVLSDAARRLEKGRLNYPDLLNMVRDAMVLGRQEEVVDYKDLSRIKVEKPREYIETGYDLLDIKLDGGLAKGMLGVVAAYTGVGKTMLLANFAFNALAKGYKVLYVSLEQSVRDISLRIDSVYAVTEGLGDDIVSVQNEEMLSKLPGELLLRDFPVKKLRVSDLSSFLYRLEISRRFKPDLLIVDYGALMKGSIPRDRWEEVGEVYEGLRGIASIHDVAVWTAAQLHREGVRIQHRSGMALRPESLIYYTRDSSVIAETSDRFLILTTENRREYKLTIAKSRTGAERESVNFDRIHQKLVERPDAF